MSIAGIRSPAHNGASGMLHNYASDLVMLSRTVTELVTHIDERNRTGLLTEAMQNVDLASIKQEIEFALEITDDISLPSTRAQLQRIHDLITHENPRGINPLYDWIRELANRLQDDAANINFIFLRSEVLRYYTDVYLFGEQVADRFPSAATDYRCCWTVPCRWTGHRDSVSSGSRVGNRPESAGSFARNFLCAKLGIVSQADQCEPHS